MIAGELTPADAAGLDVELVRGIATAHGTATAHAAILSRALGLPAVVGTGEPALRSTRTPLVLDGGTVKLTSRRGGAGAEARERAEMRRPAARKRSRRRTSRPTADGPRVEVAANLGEPAARRPRWSSGRRAPGCCVPSSCS